LCPLRIDGRREDGMIEIVLAGILFALFPVHFGLLLLLSFRKTPRIGGSILPSTSILIPALNEEKVIGNTIEAILKCDYPRDKVEIIIIASGSTDRTVGICEKYSPRHHVKVLTKTIEKGGKPAALNLGLSMASNDVVVIFDADSVVGPSSLRALVEPLAIPEVAAVIGPVGMINDNENILTRSTSLEFAWVFKSSELRNRLGLLVPFSGSNRCFRREVLEKLGGFDEDSLVEDIDLSIRLAQQGGLMVFSPYAMIQEEAIANWRVLSRQRERWMAGTRESLKKSMPRAKVRIKLGLLLGIFHAMLPIWLMFSFVSLPFFLVARASLLAACALLTFCLGLGLLTISLNDYGKRRFSYLAYVPVWAAIAFYTTLTKPLKRVDKWIRTEKKGRYIKRENASIP
jgi:cellulose synthase/poly-beta-1,6-N-acetylglucosamine synthase-like glycosyltransferase